MDPNEPKKLRKERNITRAFSRFAASKDGQTILAYIEKQTGWHEAGPANPATESLQFWTGQRSVVKLFHDSIKKGKTALGIDEPDETEDSNE